MNRYKKIMQNLIINFFFPIPFSRPMNGLRKMVVFCEKGNVPLRKMGTENNFFVIYFFYSVYLTLIFCEIRPYYSFFILLFFQLAYADLPGILIFQ